MSYYNPDVDDLPHGLVEGERAFITDYRWSMSVWRLQWGNFETPEAPDDWTPEFVPGSEAA